MPFVSSTIVLPCRYNLVRLLGFSPHHCAEMTLPSVRVVGHTPDYGQISKDTASRRTGKEMAPRKTYDPHRPIVRVEVGSIRNDYLFGRWGCGNDIIILKYQSNCFEPFLSFLKGGFFLEVMYPVKDLDRLRAIRIGTLGYHRNRLVLT